MLSKRTQTQTEGLLVRSEDPEYLPPFLLWTKLSKGQAELGGLEAGEITKPAGSRQSSPRVTVAPCTLPHPSHGDHRAHGPPSSPSPSKWWVGEAATLGMELVTSLPLPYPLPVRRCLAAWVAHSQGSHAGAIGKHRGRGDAGAGGGTVVGRGSSPYRLPPSCLQQQQDSPIPCTFEVLMGKYF